ncbi:LITAF-like zinc ribbon domain family protein [Acanthocheilonema viteae]
MNANDYPPPKYEEILKNDTDNSIITDTTTTNVSSFPTSLSPLAGMNIASSNGNIISVAPFRVNFIPSTAPIFGPNSIETDCPYCQAHIVTSVQRIVGTLPWLIMGICFLLGFFLLLPWCLCCVPFYMDNCRDVVHSCPSCKRILGRFIRV